jgi:hypothetical protein
VTALLLEQEHHLGQLLRLNLAARPALADIIVLTVLAAEVAPREEDGAGSVGATQGILLPKMGAIAGDPGANPGVARSARLGAINIALAAAEVTPVQALIGDFHTLS